MNAQEYLKHWEQGEAAALREARLGSLERLVSLRQTLSWINQSLRHPRMDYHQQMQEILQRLSTINTMELRDDIGRATELLREQANADLSGASDATAPRTG